MRSRCPSATCYHGRSPSPCRKISSTARSGQVLRKPPHSEIFEVIGPRRSRLYCAITLKIRAIPPNDSFVQRRADDAWSRCRVWPARRCRRRGKASGVAGSGTRRRKGSLRGGREAVWPRCPAGFDTDRALALEQDTRGQRMGLGAQVRARSQMRMDVAARGSSARRSSA